ncbi:hypothetical protein GGX14DRAFT_620293 [Mycena pura]|uniref:Uncharacterized protein n=1 Tax=Mycena pura TaxID=153505 RepID=A0AAD6YIT1_9AGAR|nr:hypothetical protein GGX14DRAFT_620293 [Mycena pura]
MDSVSLPAALHHAAKEEEYGAGTGAKTMLGARPSIDSVRSRSRVTRGAYAQPRVWHIALDTTPRAAHEAARRSKGKATLWRTLSCGWKLAGPQARAAAGSNSGGPHDQCSYNNLFKAFEGPQRDSDHRPAGQARQLTQVCVDYLARIPEQRVQRGLLVQCRGAVHACEPLAPRSGDIVLQLRRAPLPLPLLLLQLGLACVRLTPDGRVDLSVRHGGCIAGEPIAKAFLNNPATIEHIGKLDPSNSDAVTTLVAELNKIHEGLKTIRVIGLNACPQSIADIIKKQNTMESQATSYRNPRIVWRNRGPSPCKRYTHLSDTSCCPEGDAIIDEEHGFLTIQQDDSVIFLSPDIAAENNKIVFELVALRAIARDIPSMQKLYEWLCCIVETAVTERRNPTHPGKMVQVGLNAGPRHDRSFGPAKSYTKVLANDTMVAHDEDVIAAMTLTWSMCKTFLPLELIQGIEKQVDEAGLPQIWTRNIGEGTSYRIKLDDQVYEFPLYGRAPSEGVLSQDYVGRVSACILLWSHTDPTHTGWTLSWNLKRTVDRPRSCGRHIQSAATATAPVGKPEFPPFSGGGNFVDLTLKVKVLQATGTLLAHRPDYPHGTTRLCGAHGLGTTIPFTSRVLTAFQTREEGQNV